MRNYIKPLLIFAALLSQIQPVSAGTTDSLIGARAEKQQILKSILDTARSDSALSVAVFDLLNADEQLLQAFSTKDSLSALQEQQLLKQEQKLKEGGLFEKYKMYFYAGAGVAGFLLLLFLFLFIGTKSALGKRKKELKLVKNNTDKILKEKSDHTLVLIQDKEKLVKAYTESGEALGKLEGEKNQLKQNLEDFKRKEEEWNKMKQLGSDGMSDDSRKTIDEITIKSYKLEKLNQLRSQNAISEEEYLQLKKSLIDHI